jgi:uncharacterized membrane protein YjfL (UPF0719 family)
MSLRDDLAVHNERVKLFAGFLNAIGLGLIGFAVIRPLTDAQATPTLLTVVWGGAGLVLHLIAHYILGMLRKEARGA